MGFQPRPKQQEVLAYTGGKMGVSAVPGSGKTWTLSRLAALLVANGELQDDQEVLVVTLVNSAVDNFGGRVAMFMREMGLLPNLGYRVRTLHGLAHDIVRERPELAGLSEDFQIIDDRVGEQILDDAAKAWLGNHPDAAEDYVDPSLDERRRQSILREKWPDLVVDAARGFIKQAKDLQLTPAELQDRLDLYGDELPLAQMGCEIYADYQRALAYRGAVDFDDLIRLALRALELDRAYLERLRHRWPYILEDEAQDSSALQERILRLLSGETGNWVRVGDPNQAIYETFTTASPYYLRRFLDEAGVRRCALPNSGRSMPSIIRLANSLTRWTQDAHPLPELRDALMSPFIEPAPPGDPQPNPPDNPAQVKLVTKKFSPEAEIAAVVESLKHWLPEHQDQTVAVLVPRNDRGFAVVEALKKQDIEVVELLRSTRTTRETAGVLGNLVAYLAEPTSVKKLSTIYRVWRRRDRDDEALKAQMERTAKLLLHCPQVEDFVWPGPGHDWLDDLTVRGEDETVVAQLEEFRRLVRRWMGTALLPIDQMLLTLAQDVFDRPADLALAHKLAVTMRRVGEQHREWRLPELTEELALVARNARKFLGLSDEDTGFDPDQHKGKVVIVTMHKAKGLEWDRVYLLSVNNYDFPSAQAHDAFMSEKWFVRGRLNLEAETLAQLSALAADEDLGAYYEEGTATQAARLKYAGERLRLLYVGITRARRELIVTWNTGRNGDQQPATPFLALQSWWEEDRAAAKSTEVTA